MKTIEMPYEKKNGEMIDLAPLLEERHWDMKIEDVIGELVPEEISV